MKRLKVYLDTNTIYGFIKEMVKASIERRDYIKTRKIMFLQSNLDKLVPTTSFFSFMEAVDSLESELRLSRDKIKPTISLFKKISKIRNLDNITLTGETYKWFLSGVSLKDSIQANIAKNENSVFVSEDKKFIRKIKKFYNNSLTFDELKKIIIKAR